MSKWWTWEWDSHEMGSGDITFDYLKRWRRGWITLYKLVSRYGDDNTETVEWRLYFPFNFNVGFEYDRKL